MQTSALGRRGGIAPELLFFLLAIVAIAAFSRPIIVRRPGARVV